MRRKVDADDRRRISEEFDRCSHPLEIESDVLYNIVNGQVAPAVVNVSDVLTLGALSATHSQQESTQSLVLQKRL